MFSGVQRVLDRDPSPGHPLHTVDTGTGTVIGQQSQLSRSWIDHGGGHVVVQGVIVLCLIQA